MSGWSAPNTPAPPGDGGPFSPDETRLYVWDTSGALGRDSRNGHHIRVYAVYAGRRVKNGRVFAAISPGCPTGSGSTWPATVDLQR